MKTYSEAKTNICTEFYLLWDVFRNIKSDWKCLHCSSKLKDKNKIEIKLIFKEKLLLEIRTKALVNTNYNAWQLNILKILKIKPYL